MSIRKFALPACMIICLMTSATAQAGVISKSEKRAIQSGQMGAIIPSITDSGRTCAFGEIAFRSLQTRRIHKAKFSNATNFMSIQHARILPLPPGYYEPLYAECVWKSSIARQVKNYSGLDKVFQPILVRGGEVVYHGTLDVKLPYGPQRPVYNLIGQPKQVYESLVRSDRDLAIHFVERPAQYK